MKRTYILMLMITAFALSTNAHAQDTSNGIIWYPPILLSDSNFDAYTPQIALTGNDTIHVTYEYGGKRLAYVKSQTSGIDFESIRDLIVDTATYHRSALHTKVVAWNQIVYLFFINADPPYPFGSHVRMVMSSDGGTMFGGVIEIGDERADHITHAAIAGDTIAVVYGPVDAERKVLRSTTNGMIWTHTDEQFDIFTRIALASRNLHLVKHVILSSASEVDYRRSSNLGTTWEWNTTLSTIDGYYSDIPSIAAYQSECGTELLTAWRDTKYGSASFAGASIISRAGLNNGDVWLPENLLTTEPRGTEPRSGVHGGTRAVSWWDEIALLVFNGMVRATNTALTEFPQAKDLSPAPATGGAPNAIAVSSHAVHVVYEQLVGGNLGTFRIFYRRGEFIQKNVTFGLSTGLLNFDSTDVGESPADTITISNSGADSLIIGTAISDNTYFAVSPATTVVPPASTAIFTVRFTPTSPGEQTGKIIFYHNGQTSPDCFAVTGVGIWRRKTINYQNDWNLVSIPVNPGYKQTLPSLFSYDSGYLPSDSLEIGKGYWAKPDSQVLYEGIGIWSDTITVKKGWNMIGSLSGPVLKNTITSVPDSLVSTDYYQYNGKAYSPTDTLHPGRSYWVKVKADGMLLLNATSSKQ